MSSLLISDHIIKYATKIMPRSRHPHQIHCLIRCTPSISHPTTVAAFDLDFDRLLFLRPSHQRSTRLQRLEPLLRSPFRLTIIIVDKFNSLPSVHLCPISSPVSNSLAAAVNFPLRYRRRPLRLAAAPPTPSEGRSSREERVGESK